MVKTVFSVTATLILVVGSLMMSVFLFYDYHNQQIVLDMQHFRIYPDMDPFSSFLIRNPKLPYEVSQLLDQGSNECDFLLLAALRGNTAWAGPRISRFRRALTLEEDYDQCRGLFLQARTAEPMNPVTWLNWGNYLVRTGRWDEATTFYSEIAQRFPGYLHKILPLLWMLDPDPERLQTSVNQDSDSLEMLGTFFEQKGLFAEALQVYMTEIRIIPDNTLLFHRIVRLYLNRLKDPEKALEMLAAHSPEPSADRSLLLEHLFLELLCYQNLGQSEKAESLAAQILDNCDNDPNWYYQLSLYYQEERQFYQAEQLIEKALLWDSTNPLYLEKLGDLYSLNNKWKQAIVEYKKAKDLLIRADKLSRVKTLDTKIETLLLKAARMSYEKSQAERNGE